MSAKLKTPMHSIFNKQQIKERKPSIVGQPSSASKSSPQTTDNKALSTYELATNQVNPEDINKLKTDFDDIYGATIYHEGIFSFSNTTEATDFFKQQAAVNRCFLIKNTDKDEFLFSDGNDNFFMGSQDELQKFLETLLEICPNQSTALTKFNSASMPSTNSDKKEETPEDIVRDMPTAAFWA